MATVQAFQKAILPGHQEVLAGRLHLTELLLLPTGKALLLLILPGLPSQHWEPGTLSINKALHWTTQQYHFINLPLKIMLHMQRLLMVHLHPGHLLIMTWH